MPNWQPKWEDVAWDHAAAEALSAELNRKADLLESSITRRAHVANYAAAEWQGAKRLLFDAYREAVMTRAQELANQYREMAERIGKASGDARSEQSHRESERRRWHDEAADEEREERQREERRRNQRQPV